MIKVEHQRAYRLFILSAACHHLLRCRKKSAPVERPSEFVGRSGIPVEAQRTLLGEHEDNESGADNIEHGLEREDGNPAVARPTIPRSAGSRPASGIGIKKIAPCSIGTKIAGHRCSTD